VSQVRSVLSGRRRAALIIAYRREWRDWTRMDPAVVRSLRKGSAESETDKTWAVWAYGLRWKPQPLIENYSLYDRTLDVYAADWLVREGPERILQSFWAIDRQNGLWQGPAFMLAELCHYRKEAGTTGQDALLVRAANRCGRTRLLGSANLSSINAWVRVPRGGRRELVYATMHVPRSLSSAIETAVYKPPQMTLVTDANEYRFIPGTAEEPHILAIPRFDDLAVPSTAGVPIRRFRIRHAPAPVRVSFFALRLRR
jgi:hypothetical protein